MKVEVRRRGVVDDWLKEFRRLPRKAKTRLATNRSHTNMTVWANQLLQANKPASIQFSTRSLKVGRELTAISNATNSVSIVTYRADCLILMSGIHFLNLDALNSGA